MRLDKSKIRGIFPAMVTPTDKADNVNKTVAKKLTGFLIESGVSGLVPLGGTGEFTALSPADRATMVETVVDEAAGRIPVVAGVLSPGFKEAVAAGLDFKKAGADGVLLITPFYIRPTQEGMTSYFSEWIARVDLPVIIYEIPYRTGVFLEPDTYRKIVDENELIIGMKACNTDMVHFCRTNLLVGEKISVLSGEEHLFTSHMVLGATGGLLATCNVFPTAWVRICDLCLAGDFVTARRLHADLVPFLDAVFAEGNPGPLKEAMQLIGFDVGQALRPLAKPRQSTIERLKATAQPLLAKPIETRA